MRFFLSSLLTLTALTQAAFSWTPREAEKAMRNACHTSTVIQKIHGAGLAQRTTEAQEISRLRDQIVAQEKDVTWANVKAQLSANLTTVKQISDALSTYPVNTDTGTTFQIKTHKMAIVMDCMTAAEDKPLFFSPHLFAALTAKDTQMPVDWNYKAPFTNIEEETARIFMHQAVVMP